MSEKIPICPRCKKPKGCVEGSWICFTAWWECGLHQYATIEARNIAKKKYAKEIIKTKKWRKEIGDNPL